jgi:hypothetical protein
MLMTVEATIDRDGTVRLAEPLMLVGPAKALVTVLDVAVGADSHVLEPALLSEAALADGWSGPAEDAAWAHLAELPAIEEDR